VLVLYPLVIGVLVAGALQQGDRRAQLAVVNLDTGGRTVEVAGSACRSTTTSPGSR